MSSILGGSGGIGWGFQVVLKGHAAGEGESRGSQAVLGVTGLGSQEVLWDRLESQVMWFMFKGLETGGIH